MSLRFSCSLFVLSIAMAVAQPMSANDKNDKHDNDNDHRKNDVCTEFDRDHGHGHAYGHDKKFRCPPRGSSSGIAKGDFNGDGIGDLAIGAPGEDLSVVILGQTRSAVNGGVVHVIYGTTASGLAASGTGIPNTQEFSEPFLSTNFNEIAGNNDNFGASLASGDFDGDGFSDLAVGVPGKNIGISSRGAVEIFEGSSTGLKTASTAFFGPDTFTTVATVSNSSGATSLTWADFNNDGFGDLAVASSYSKDGGLTQLGCVTVLFGSAAGLSTAGKLQFEFDTHSVQNPFPLQPVPLVLSAGDFNHDGFSDLVAGSPTANLVGPISGAGVVHVLFGSPTGPRLAGAQTWSENSPNIPSSANQNEEFGTSVAVGDFNGDTFDDLAVGAPRELVGSNSLSAGAVFEIFGSSVGLQSPSSGALVSRTFIQSDVPGSTANAVAVGDFFGNSLAAADFNGDGFKDLAIGAPGDDIAGVSQAGTVNVIYGSSTGLDPNAIGSRAPDTFHEPSFMTPQTSDEFGTSLIGWNFGQTAAADLAIGMPLKNWNGVTDAGAVVVFYGSTTGLTPFLQVWAQGTNGLPDTPRAGNHFGQAVY